MGNGQWRTYFIYRPTFNSQGFQGTSGAIDVWNNAVGRISDCTIDIGHGKIDIAPVIEGAVQHIISRRFEIGGVDLTKLLAQELDKSNPTVNLNITDVERLKEQYSCCTENEIAYEKILDVQGWMEEYAKMHLKRNNAPFKDEMQRFVKKIKDLMQKEMLFFWQGGPIIML